MPILYVVVDTSDNYVFSNVPRSIRRDHAMTARSSQEFCKLLNSERKPGKRTFRVFQLTPVTGGRRRSIR